MPGDDMKFCQLKKLFMREGEKVFEWVDVPVSTLSSGGHRDIRCMHCHGEVRVHKKQVDHGPADHVEHCSGQDSMNCKGGYKFSGVHRMSLNSVE